MSADVTIVHSDEFDNPSILPAPGWYVCALRGQECEAANGPYSTEGEAALAMTGRTTPSGMGCWLFPDLEWSGTEMRPKLSPRATCPWCSGNMNRDGVCDYCDEAGVRFDETSHYRSQA